jgi:hypothetical protein
MQTTSDWARFLFISGIVFASIVCVRDVSAARKTPVEVWCGGDDGLTQRLRDGLEKAFESSPDFNLISGSKPRKLIVTIPTHVKWMKVEKRTLIDYTVEFTSANNHALGTFTGSCWDDEMTQCVAQIMGDARGAARRIH